MNNNPNNPAQNPEEVIDPIEFQRQLVPLFDNQALAFIAQIRAEAAQRDNDRRRPHVRMRVQR